MNVQRDGLLGPFNGRAVSVIIVNWNTRDAVRCCIDSLERATAHIEHEVIVVDNASNDGTAEMVAASFPNVTIIRNVVNRGFAGGVNEGLRIAGGECLVILNPDILVDRSAIDQLLSLLHADNKIGAAMPVLLMPDGTAQRGYARKLPSVAQTVLFDTQLEGWSRRQRRLVDRYLEREGGGDLALEDVDQIPGAFIATRRDVINAVGGMDEQFPLFYEDVDWSFRVRQAGFRLVCVRNAHAVHGGGTSFTVGDSSWLLGRFRASQVLFFEKHRSRMTALFIRCVHILNSSSTVVRKTIVIMMTNGKACEEARIARLQHLRLLTLLLCPGHVPHRGLPS